MMRKDKVLSARTKVSFEKAFSLMDDITDTCGCNGVCGQNGHIDPRKEPEQECLNFPSAQKRI